MADLSPQFKAIEKILLAQKALVDKEVEMGRLHAEMAKPASATLDSLFNTVTGFTIGERARLVGLHGEINESIKDMKEKFAARIGKFDKVIVLLDDTPAR